MHSGQGQRAYIYYIYIYTSQITIITYIVILFFFPSGVAHDIRNNLYFWIIDGGQSPLYRYNSATDEVSQLLQRLDRPMSLAADWVGRRLFWVQDGFNVGFMNIHVHVYIHVYASMSIANDCYTYVHTTIRMRELQCYLRVRIRYYFMSAGSA